MTDDDCSDSYERAEAMEMAVDRIDEERAALNAKIADLDLRLHIATETNVADRNRITDLEAGLLEAIALIEGTTLCESQYPDFRDDPDWITAQRLRAMLPSTIHAPPR